MKRIFRRSFQMQRARRLHYRGAAVLVGGKQRLRRKVREIGTSSMRIPSKSETDFKVTCKLPAMLRAWDPLSYR